MYVEGREAGVKDWVAAVHNLRYKDYQLVTKPMSITRECSIDPVLLKQNGLHESETVKNFGQAMRDRGVYSWWRKGMGYDNQEL